jgi:antitoxin VapB
MPEVTAKVFRNGRNQAIRIPVEFSFDTDTVILEKRGDTLVVRPKLEAGWDRFLDDESMVLPEEFDTGEDAPPPDRPPL